MPLSNCIQWYFIVLTNLIKIMFLFITEISCPSPNVRNAFWRGPQNYVFQYKETISVQCNRGYTMTGPRTITCGIDGHWIPALPTCKWTGKWITFVCMSDYDCTWYSLYKTLSLCLLMFIFLFPSERRTYRRNFHTGWNCIHWQEPVEDESNDILY